MTRKSRRELQRDLEDLGDDVDDDGHLTDAARGVTAPWVTYEPEGPDDLPEGATVYTPGEDA